VKQKSKWEIMFNYLIEYKDIHGDCLVPNRYKPLPALGAWVSTQRRHYRIYTGELLKAQAAASQQHRTDEESDNSGVAGKMAAMTVTTITSTPLTPERIRLLESVGFVWATSDPRHVSRNSYW